MNSLVHTHCSDGHSFEPKFKSLAQKMFNVFAKNLASDQNSNLHHCKKRGGTDTKGRRKIAKLNSQ